MRKNLTLAALGLAVAASLLPVATASANCVQIGGSGPCINPCGAALNAYRNADTAAGGVLPGLPFACTA